MRKHLLRIFALNCVAFVWLTVWNVQPLLSDARIDAQLAAYECQTASGPPPADRQGQGECEALAHYRVAPLWAQSALLSLVYMSLLWLALAVVYLTVRWVRPDG